MSSQRTLRRGIGEMSIDAEDKARRAREVDTAFEIEKFFRERFRFEPLADEARIMLRIEEVSERLAAEMFGEAEQALERFYASVRTPETEVIDGERVTTVRDGKIVWRKDETGRFIEDWDRLEGIELEATILALQRVILTVSDEVSKLYGRALVADKVRDDAWAEFYRKPIEGTKDDRAAYATLHTREPRWYFYACFLVHRRLSDKLQEMKETKKTLEFFRSRMMKLESG